MTAIDAREVAAPVTRPAAPMFVPTDFLMVVAVAMWGFNFPIVKYGTRIMPSLAFNGVRITFAALALLVFAALLARTRPTRREVIILLTLGVLGNGIYQMVFIGSVVNTDVGVAALLLASSPAFIALFSRIAGLGPISTRCKLGIALSLVGVALISLTSRVAHDGSSSLEGNLLAVAAAVIWAIYTVLQARFAPNVEDINVAALTITGGAIPLLLIGLPSIAATHWSVLPSGAFLAIGFSGILSLAIASVIWYRGVRVLGATRAGVYLNLEPAFAMLAAWIWFRDQPTLLQGVGAVTILAGVTLTHT